MADQHTLLPIEFATCIVFLCGLTALGVFGCITVRRLRRNPALRDLLGWQPLPGFATLNASFALSASRSLVRMLEISPLRALSADPAALHRHTAPWERRLARFAWRSLLLSVVMAFASDDLRQWGAVTGTAIAAGHAAAFLLALAVLGSVLTFGERVRLWRIARFGRNRIDKWWDGVLDNLR